MAWKNEINTVKPIEFNQTLGINPETLKKLDEIYAVKNGINEHDVFMQFVDDSFWQLIVNETNNDAKTFYSSSTANKKEKWFDCTIDEIKAFFALIVLMGQLKKPSISHYWSRRYIIKTTVFNEIMPYSRFLLISRFLRFSKKTESNNPQDKLSTILDMIIKKFKSIYTPDRALSVDESLVKFKGRFKHRQYIPNKRARTGIKLFKCCESKSGYCLDLLVYTQNFVETKELLVSEQIVFKVANDYLNKGYIIYMDNWFTSPSLIKKLLEKNTYSVGTAKSNRKFFPEDIVIKKKDKKQLKGNIEYRSANNILALRYVDRKNVYFLTSFNKQLEKISIQKYNEVIQRPECIDDYNKNMGGVDKHDQKLASFSIIRKNLKWYKKLFVYLFDMIIQNSCIIFYKYTKLKDKETFSNFRLNLVECILANINLPNYSKRSPKNQLNPLRYNINHKCILENIPSTPKKKQPTLRCKYCSQFKVRRETVYRCKHCLVALHKDCFKKYHDKNFKIKSMQNEQNLISK